MKKFIRSLFEKRDQNTEKDPEPENTENKSQSIWEMPKVDGSEKSTIDLVKRDIKIEEKRKLDLRAEEKLRHFRELEKKKKSN